MSTNYDDLRQNRQANPQDEQQSAVEVLAPTTIQLMQSAEIDQQIATAKKYPRQVTTFIRRTTQLACLNEQTARSCNYALPRREWDEDKNQYVAKAIEGPSARLAEIVASQWGNCRYGARIVAEDDRFVTAQGVFHDLENNAFVTFEVRRRITNKHGKRYSDDMVAVTANAACSIALRNAVFKGVPKAIWDNVYQDARRVAAGSAETLAQRRDNMLAEFAKLGVKPEEIYAVLEVKGKGDVGLDELVLLAGIWTAVQDGDTTVEQAFGREKTDQKPASPAPAQKKASKKQQQDPPPAETTAEKPAAPETQQASDQNAPPQLNFAEAFAAIAKARTIEDLDMVRSQITSLTEAQQANLTVSIENKMKSPNFRAQQGHQQQSNQAPSLE